MPANRIDDDFLKKSFTERKQGNYNN